MHDKDAPLWHIKGKSKLQENNWTKHLKGQNNHRKIKLFWPRDVMCTPTIHQRYDLGMQIRTHTQRLSQTRMNKKKNF